MEVNAHSRAISRGYAYVQCEGGKVIAGVWCNCFTKTAANQPPFMFIGWDHSRERWVTQEVDA